MVSRPTFADEPKADRGSVTKVASVKTSMYYRVVQGSDTMLKERRKYYVGKAYLCHVEVLNKGYGKTISGEFRRWVCYMGITSEYGNGSTSYETEDDLHAFLGELVTAKPN